MPFPHDWADAPLDPAARGWLAEMDVAVGRGGVIGNRSWGLGDSLIAGTYDQMQASNPHAWACVLSDGKMYLKGTSNLPGATSVTTLTNGKLDEVLTNANSIDHCVVLLGPNDASLGVSAANSAVAFSTIFGKLQAAGIVPVICTVPPNSNGFHDAINKLNWWLRDYASKNKIPIADINTALVNPTNGNYAANMSSDGVHLTALGAKTAGQVIYNAIANYLAPFAPYLPTSNDLTNGQLNPLMLTDTNADGVPDNFTLAGAGATAALGADAAVLGNAWTITVAAAQAIGRSSIITASVGDTIYFSCRVKSTVKAFSSAAYITLLTPTGTKFISRPLDGATEDYGWNTLSGMGRVPAGGANAQMNFTLDPGAGATLKIAQVAVLNLSTLGLA
jgi:lysophospholipase L1-like esterase